MKTVAELLTEYSASWATLEFRLNGLITAARAEGYSDGFDDGLLEGRWETDGLWQDAYDEGHEAGFESGLATA